MNDYDSQGSEPFDVERASFTQSSPGPFASNGQPVDSAGFPVLDSDGFPVPPPPSTSPAEGKGKSNFPNMYKKQEQTENSSSTSASGGPSSDSSTDQENSVEGHKKQGGKSNKKYAIIAVLLMLLFLITVSIVTYFILAKQKSDEKILSPDLSDKSSEGPMDTSPPTSPPTRTTPSPTSNLFEEPIREFLFEDSNVSVEATDPAVEKAVKWLVHEANSAKSLVFPLDQKYLQRFGMLILYFSLNPNVEATSSDIVRLPNKFMKNNDECSWIGMKCDPDGKLFEIELSHMKFDGTLPNEWGFFPNLIKIDFSDNQLEGSIPEGMYDILGLKEVHLYKNRLTGTISSKIGNLWSLERFHVNNNKLSGGIPPELGSSGAKIRPIRSFNVHRNQLTGPIPSNLRLRKLYYMDLGNNFLAGTVPKDLGTDSIRLRHLYLDHNNFHGSFPSEVLNAGNGRLKILALNDNRFTGKFPDEHQLSNSIMVELTIQNNNFASMGANICFMDLWMGGDLVEFRSDCDICACGDTYLCQNCEP